MATVPSPEEYVVCLDSFLTVPGPNDQLDPDNPTNDIRLKVQTTVNRLQVKSIELATLELPAAQLLIEDPWSRLYFSTGVPMTGSALGRSLTVATPEDSFTAELPLTLNRIVALDDSDPTTPVFTTAEPHLLQSAAQFWSWGEAVALVSTAVEANLTPSGGGALLPTVTVISDTTFSVSGFPPATVWIPNAAATTFGYLHYPEIPTYGYLASILQSLLFLDVGALIYRVEYVTTEGHFCIHIPQSLFSRIPEHFLDSVLEVTVGSLPFLLGFGEGRIALAHVVDPPVGCQGNGFRCAKGRPEFRKVCSVACQSLGICHIRLVPGNYPLEADLLAEINFQANRMFLDPVGAPYALALSDETGTSYSITLPTGLYQPTTLAATVQQLILAAWPGSDIQVTFEDNDFVFHSPSGTAFNLEFQSSFTNVAERLGFLPIRYAGQTEYRSNLPFEYTDCDPNCIITFGMTNSHSGRMLVSASAPPPLSIAGTTGAVVGNELVVTSTQAHGFRVGDIAVVTVGGTSFRLVVLRTPSGTQLVLDAAALVLPVGAMAVGRAPTGCKLSLMFAVRLNNRYIFGILGFRREDKLWTPDFTGTYTAPNLVSLSNRSYVLLQLVDPPGSARLEHTSITGHTPSNLFGKGVLVVQPLQVQQRFFPERITFFPSQIIEYLHIRILNSDGVIPYFLKGRHWSCTFRFFV